MFSFTSFIRNNNFLNWLKKSYIYIVLLVIYIPLIFIIILSFNGQTEKGNINVNFGVPTIENYLFIIQDNEFLTALLNSFLVVLIVTPLATIIATMTCFGIWNSKNTYKSAIMSASKITIVNPEPITGISLALLFASTWTAVGLNLGYFTVVLAHLSFCTPYAIITIYPRMAKMPKNLILASYDLGYSKIATFFKVTIPYLLPAILSGAAIATAMSLDDFVITILVNGNFNTIGTAIYSTRKGIKAWVVTFGAIVVILTIVVMIIVGIVKKYKEVNSRKNKKY